jgi:hypothetical protein
MCGMLDCVEALAFNIWRDHITNTIHTAVFEWRLVNSTILLGIRDKLAHFEDEFPKLKEATPLWKVAMTVNENIHQDLMCGYQDKINTDNAALHVELMLSSNMYSLFYSLRKIQNSDFNHE